MATLLFVRTSSAGTAPDVLIDDLGFTISTGAAWTILSSSSPQAALGSDGQFTARELRDSEDLFLLISAGTLEWSTDAIVAELAADYRADYMIIEDFSDDGVPFDINRMVLETDGAVTYIGDGDIVITTEPLPNPVED